MAAGGDVDIGPLAWVLDELRKSIDGAIKLMRRFVLESQDARDADLIAIDVGTLRQAKAHLHQACGAMDMVGMPAAALLLQVMEHVAQRYVHKPENCTESAVQRLEQTGFALLEYLDAVLAGKNISAVALFPQYRDLQALMGNDKVQPADLWGGPLTSATPPIAVNVPALLYDTGTRSRLEQAVLQLVKSADAVAAARLKDISLGLLRTAGAEQPHAVFWGVAAGFFDSLASRLLVADVYVKRVASRVLMQYSAFAKGDKALPERLLQEMLFFCAQTQGGVGRATVLETVRASMGLQQHAPVDYAEPRFGRFDPAVLALARKRIGTAAETWSSLVGGDKSKLKAAVDQFSLVCDSLQRLHADSGVLVQALTRVMQQMVQRGEVPDTAVSMEVATSVLYLQAAFATLDFGDTRMAAHAQVLADRLHKAQAGAAVQPLEPWMEDLYRQASDAQTMGSVVGELRGTLDEAEKVLDQFFRHPTDATLLSPVVGHLSQMRGVLSVLGLDQASLAMLRMREVVERLLQGAAQPAEQVQLFDRLGNSLGALGFLIDMLSYQRAMARKLFVYDEQRGELCPVMGRFQIAESTSEKSADVHSVQQEGTSASGAFSGTSPALAPTSKIDTPTHFAGVVPGDAPSVAEPSLYAAAQDVHERHAQDPHSDVHAEPVGELAAQEHPVDAVPLLAPEPDGDAPVPTATSGAAAHVVPSDAEADDELRGIFLEEAREVITIGKGVLQELAELPSEMEAQTTLRRAFHTLKGSARMVGLDALGEAAWSFEQLLNAWLPEQQAMPVAMHRLCVQALDGMADWVDAIESNQAAAWRSDAFRASADAMRLHATSLPLEKSAMQGDAAEPGRPFVSPAVENVAPERNVPVLTDTVHALLDSEAVIQVHVEETLGIQQAEIQGAEEVAVADAVLEGETLESVDRAAEPVPQDDVLMEGQEFGATEVQEASPAMQEELAALEQLVFTANTPADVPLVEVAGLSLADAVVSSAEALPQAAEAVPREATEEICQIGPLQIPQPLLTVYLGEAQEWSQQLQAALQAWSTAPETGQPTHVTVWAHGLAGSSATVGFLTLSGFARALEFALLHVQPLGNRVPAQTVGIFAAAAEEIRAVLHQFAAGFLRVPQAVLQEQLDAIAAQELPMEWQETSPEAITHGGPDAVQPPDSLKEVFASDVVAASVVRTQSTATPVTGEEGMDVVDIIDPDLFPIFEDEAVELLPALGASMRQWAQQPRDDGARIAVLRALHTLKGSARLAGAMRLGELAHRLESAMEALDPDVVTSPDIEPLLHRVDVLQANFDRLRSVGEQDASEPVVAPDAEDSLPVIAPPVQADSVSPSKAKPAAPAAVRGPQQQTVRVRSQLLDRLINEAGEVLIARSRLDARMTVVHNALSDLGGNLERLRQQLRDLEVQAESQMQSRKVFSKEVGSDFDPLEFDRFTRVQELTRMMAESVNDVATVQRNLQREVTGAEDDLIAQGRQARELQRDLLRTRMVEFDSVAERLYAVVRNAAKETGKQVKLDIDGGTIEVDRGVLERMTPAFEHLLRNCVGHGIESPAARAQADKPAQGVITVDVQQEGNDVSVAFHDDGAGLDVERIRAKALEQGLIAADTTVDGAKAAELIFMPGFSTATTVTGLSGRGIGMDVVRSEVQALGGRIETVTTAGQGSSFRMVLPLTTAVTQVVMLRVGDFSVGVPANLMETVRRVTLPELEEAYRTGGLQDGKERLPFYWAGAVWQQSARSNEEGVGRTRPVLLLRSAAQRIALHVDEVLGNQEVVVKHLGPQVARLPGLTGMSVLPSGAVVLIYNPVALTTVYADRIRAAGATALQDAVAPAGEAPGNGLPLLGGVSSNPVPLVMVVDDSITVRRVTQRLLQREGYRVVMASDGVQALEKLQGELPCMVLSDIEMPHMDGFDLARHIRADERLKHLPLVMITSRTADKHREHALSLGANHYLGKPYRDEELMHLVHHYAGQAQQAQLAAAQVMVVN
ncbi:MAG: Hpt domain-containing protein [Comamonas sp.]